MIGDMEKGSRSEFRRSGQKSDDPGQKKDGPGQKKDSRSEKRFAGSKKDGPIKLALSPKGIYFFHRDCLKTA